MLTEWKTLGESWNGHTITNGIKGGNVWWQIGSGLTFNFSHIAKTDEFNTHLHSPNETNVSQSFKLFWWC